MTHIDVPRKGQTSPEDRFYGVYGDAGLEMVDRADGGSAAEAVVACRRLTDGPALPPISAKVSKNN